MKKIVPVSWFLVLILMLCGSTAHSQTFTGYDVIVITGTMDGAGTDANISLKLFGTKGSTPNFIGLSNANLTESTGGLFENSSWDTFRLVPGTVADYGSISRIEIKHDNANNRPGWHLGAVVVINRFSGEESVFFADRWLARDEVDKQIDIYLDKSGAVHRTFKPPYELSSPWDHDTIGVSDAKVWSNKNTGAIGVYCDAWTGGSTGTSDMGIKVNVSTPATLFVRSRIIYCGGNINYAIASFSDLYSVRYINNSEYKRAISPAFSGPVVLDKIVALAGIAAGGIGKAAEAVEIMCAIYDVLGLLNNLVNLYNAGNASRIWESFAFRTNNGNNTVRVGMRGDATGVLTGSAFVIIGGMVEFIEVVGYVPSPPSQTSSTAAAAPAQNQTTAAQATQIKKSCSETLEYPKYGRCWGWHQTHTYDLGSSMTIVSVSGNVTAGPSEKKGVSFPWQIRVSADGTNWQNAGGFTAVGAQSKAFGSITVNRTARYVQIYTAGNGYVDASDITVTKQ